MIKFEHTEVVGWEHVIRGMRNPKNSWEKSDSFKVIDGCENKSNCRECEHWNVFRCENIGSNDHDLMMRLAKGGPVHAKYRRMITVYVDIIAPLYWWKEFDTYKVGTVSNSCSTMHKIADKEFTLEDFSTEHLLGDYPSGFDYNVAVRDPENINNLTFGECFFTPMGILNTTIDVLNVMRHRYLKTKDKKYWWQMIQLLPSSYNQKRTIMFNYEVLANIYKSRKDHKLDEWRTFCSWIEELPYSEVIIGKYLDEENKDLKDIPICNTDVKIKKALGVISPSEHIHIWANGKRINTTPETEEFIKDLLKKEDLSFAFDPKKDIERTYEPSEELNNAIDSFLDQLKNGTGVRDPIIDKLLYIRVGSNRASQFELLAEESVELAHVAQKMARFLRDNQPVSEDFDFYKAYDNLIEEFADVLLSGYVAIDIFNEDGTPTDKCRSINEIFQEKAYRWVKRLEKKNGEHAE